MHLTKHFAQSQVLFQNHSPTPLSTLSITPSSITKHHHHLLNSTLQNIPYKVKPFLTSTSPTHNTASPQPSHHYPSTPPTPNTGPSSPPLIPLASHPPIHTSLQLLQPTTSLSPHLQPNPLPPPPPLFFIPSTFYYFRE